MSCLYPPSISWHKNSRPLLQTGDRYYFNNYMFGIYVLGNVSKGPSCKIDYAFSFSITPVGFSVFTEDKTICLILHYNDLLAYSQPNSRTGIQSKNFQLFFSLMQIFFYIVTNIRVHYFNLIYFLPIYIGSFENYGKHNSAII